MIKFKAVSFAYQQNSAVIIRDFNAELKPGEFNLVVGKTGSGKSTLLNLINGSAPHLTGGLLAGDIEVFGFNTMSYKPRDLAETVGVVGQKPRDGFVTSTVKEELAYSLECQGVDIRVMQQRIDETSELVGLKDSLAKPLEILSAGMQQRVAIASVLVNRPKVLVLDEPTSALDPPAAEEVLGILQRLTYELGISIVVAEHRLERILQFADRLIYVPGEGSRILVGDVKSIIPNVDLAPPIVQLAKQLNWQPTPLNVRAAKKFTAPLLQSLTPIIKPSSEHAEVLSTLSNVTVRFANVQALNGISFSIQFGETLAVLGKNGAGKSTLLATLAGLIKPDYGDVNLLNLDPAKLSGKEFLKYIGFVPQEPADLLLQTTIDEECALTDQISGLPDGTTKNHVKKFLPEISFTQHPLDLSEGQQLLLTLSIVLVNSPKLILLDEPTRGLDYFAKNQLINHLKKLKTSGISVVVATHDVELVAELEARVVLLADGGIIANGPAREVLLESIDYTPQITRAFAPLNLLTIQEAVDAIQLAG